MNDDLPPPLDPALLDALRQGETAPDAVRVRARARLLTSVALSGPGGAGGEVISKRQGAALAAKVGGIAFLLGGAAGAFLYARFASEPPRVVYVDRVAPVETAPAPPVVVANASSVPSTLVGPTIPLEPSSAPGSHASQLTAERILLDQARSALAQGDVPRALERLQHHRQTFPTPLLGEERDAMWISALVKVGRYDEARARAEAFHHRFPDSLFSSLVDSAVESIP